MMSADGRTKKRQTLTIIAVMEKANQEVNRVPPKLNDGGFVPYKFFDQDGRPVTIKTVELPPEPGYEPPKEEYDERTD